MRPLNSRQPSRLAIVIVPVVVVVAVVVLMIALSIAAAVAQGIDETGTSLASTPEDPSDDVEEIEGSAPSINKVIVVSGVEPVEAVSVTSDQSQLQSDEPVEMLPATGLHSSVALTAVAIVAAGALAVAIGARGVS